MAAGSVLVVVLVYFAVAWCLCADCEAGGTQGGRLAWIYCDKIPALAAYYQEHIRGHMFAAFLALGGFLLSLKTFIVVTMKEKVYDSAAYQQRFTNNVNAGLLNKESSLYGPLQQLSDQLFYAIAASLAAAALQMSVGLVPHWMAAMICIASALFAFVLLCDGLRLVKSNLDIWFNDLEKERS